jgi:hypothetical protein
VNALGLEQDVLPIGEVEYEGVVRVWREVERRSNSEASSTQIMNAQRLAKGQETPIDVPYLSDTR